MNAENIDPNIYFNKGKEELHRSNYNASLSNFLKYIQIEEQLNEPDNRNLVHAYLGAGKINNLFSDHEQALDFYFKGLKISIKLKDESLEFKFMNNIIGTYCDSKKLDEAEKFNEKIRYYKNINKGLREEYYFFNKGFIEKNKGNDAEMVKNMNEAIKCIDKYSLNKKMKLYPYSEIYMAYERQGKLKIALSILDQYYALAKNVDQKYLVVDCFRGYMRLYTKLGDKEKALYYQDQYFKYSDSLLNLRVFNQVRNSYQNYEKYISNLKIENLEKVSTLQRRFLLLVLFGLCVTVVVAIIIFRQRQRLYLTNIALYKRNRELLEATSKKWEKINKEQQLAEEPVEEENISKAPYSNDELLEKINNVMEDEDVFCDPEFSLAGLAKLVDSNTSYVSQVINATYNENFRTFIYEYRIRVAMKRLTETGKYDNYNIQGIAESVGYKSSSNFISAFKKVTGMTPSLYQKMAKEEEK
jgi:AraC-like DNA-binding protein